MAESKVFHLLDICACGESFLASGEDDGADGVIVVVALQGVVEFEEEGGGEGVEGAGAVEGDCGVTAVSAPSAMDAGAWFEGFPY